MVSLLSMLLAVAWGGRREEGQKMSTSLPVMVLVLIGVLLVGLGLFAAGNIWVAALGVASVAFAGVLQVMGQRRG